MSMVLRSEVMTRQLEFCPLAQRLPLMGMSLKTALVKVSTVSYFVCSFEFANLVVLLRLGSAQAPRAVRVTAENAQAVFPPNACVFVAK